MNYITVKKEKSGNYWFTNITNEKINLITELLVDNISNDVYETKKYLSIYNGAGFDSVGIKKKNSKIEIYESIPEYCEDESEYYSIEMPYNKFMEMLDRWKIAFADRPDEIIVMMDDEYNVTFECMPKKD